LTLAIEAWGRVDAEGTRSNLTDALDMARRLGHL
jgi:hypothetical protein